MATPRKPRSKAPRRIKLVSPTREERRLAKEMAAEHPWRLTYGEFLGKVASEHGYEVCEMPATDPITGATSLVPCLKSIYEEGSLIYLPNLEKDVVLDEIVAASLCVRIGIPPEEFGLKSEPPYFEDFGEFT